MLKYRKQITVIVFLIFGVLFSLSSVAQLRPQQLPVERQIKILKDKLKLKDEQINKIKYILEDQREELGIAASNYRGDKQVMEETIQEIIKNTDEKIKAVLNEKQNEDYKNIIEEREAKINKQKENSNN